MFFNKPYSSFYPYSSGMFQRPKFNWSGLLNGTQKTLGIINQAIPVFYQIGPMYRNAKTMFKVVTEFNKINTNDSTTSNNTTNDSTTNQPTSNPSFFL